MPTYIIVRYRHYILQNIHYNFGCVILHYEIEISAWELHSRFSHTAQP